jgi:hypothetical protein
MIGRMMAWFSNASKSLLVGPRPAYATVASSPGLATESWV